MCRLLGVSAQTSEFRPGKSKVNPALRDFFEKFSDTNPDGWGVAFTSLAGQHVLFKEPIAASRSTALRHLLQHVNFNSGVLVAHVRRISAGPLDYTSSQPFMHTGTGFTLAHNGTVSYSAFKNADRGKSDSACMYDELVRNLSASNASIFKALRQYNHHGGMSILIARNGRLIAYRDARGSFQLWYKRTSYGYLVSSEPFLGQGWKAILPGTAIVFHEGRLESRLV